jgi:hypothetical protein
VNKKIKKKNNIDELPKVIRKDFRLKNYSVLYQDYDHDELGDEDYKLVNNVNMNELIDYIIAKDDFQMNENLLLSKTDLCELLTSIKDRNTIGYLYRTLILFNLGGVKEICQDKVIRMWGNLIFSVKFGRNYTVHRFTLSTIKEYGSHSFVDIELKTVLL